MKPAAPVDQLEPSTPREHSFAGVELTVLLFGLLVFVVALAIRWWGIDFGLPLVVHMDEWEQALASAQLDQNGAISGPRAWRYPPLVAQAISIASSLGLCPGSCEGIDRVVLGRQLSALFTSLGALACFGAARGLGMRAHNAALAGLLLAVLPLATRLGRYCTPDALAYAMAAFALWGAARIAKHGARRDYLLAAVFIGLAAAAKYNAGVVAGAYVFGAWLYRAFIGDSPTGEPPGPQKLLVATGPLVMAALWSLAVFAIALSWPWSSWADFSGGLELEWRHYVNGHAGFDCDNAAWEALIYLVSFGVGPMICASMPLAWLWLAQLGVRRPLDRSDPNAQALIIATLISASAGVVYGLLLARQEVFFARLCAPLLPAACLFVAAVVQRLSTDALPLSKHPALLVVTCALLSVPLAQSVRQAQILSRPDARVRASDWLRAEFVDAHAKHRIAVVPQSTLRGLPTGLHLKGVPPTDTISRLRARRFTHVLYGQGGVDRYRWRPERYTQELQPYLDFHESLEKEASLVMRFSGAELPGARHFGEAGALIHNYTIELWAL